jgi:hypothetical protein
VNTFDIQSEFQGSFQNRRPSTRFIAVHHAAATFSGQQGISHVRAVSSHHVDVNGWPGIGYHICLAEENPGGPIARYNVSDLELVRAHVARRNSEAVGIACLTDFSDRIPEQKWIDALAEVLRDVKVAYPDAEIVGHGDIALPGHRTACPGIRWAEWKPTLLQRVEAGLEPAGRTVTAASTLLVTAQMIHETGNLSSWWSQRPRRNPAGIGVTGETRRADPGDPHAWAWNEERGLFAAGISFPTWTEHGIPAHVGRLLAYALPAAAPLTAGQRRLVETALSVRPLPDRLRGSAPTLDGLVGTWAVPGRQTVDGRGVTYAESIADIARRILSR